MMQNQYKLESPVSPRAAIALTHGAGANSESKLLTVFSHGLVAANFAVLRFDLPFRVARRFGPPPMGSAEKDRHGIREALKFLREKFDVPVYAAGHSYGGRQSSMLLAENPSLADGLLLLSYPLHPPRKPAQLRTQHFPELRSPAFFIHGTRDPFGSIEEMERALQQISASTILHTVENVGHELLSKAGDSKNLMASIHSFSQFASMETGRSL
jgi:uncharacterized protein